MSDCLFSSVEPDPMGVILGTGYQRFESPFGISGLMKCDNDRLDVLAVVARVEGRGAFRRFIDQAKKRFSVVCVWHDMNPLIGQALTRYGFTPAKEIQSDGEIMEGWKWVEGSITEKKLGATA